MPKYRRIGSEKGNFLRSTSDQTWQYRQCPIYPPFVILWHLLPGYRVRILSVIQPCEHGRIHEPRTTSIEHE
jgi:hypothetical protein